MEQSDDRPLTWVDLEDALWTAVLQKVAADLPLRRPLPDRLRRLVEQRRPWLPRSARGSSLFLTLWQAIGDDVHLILNSRSLGEASGDATSRLLERVARAGEGRISWRVPAAAWELTGVARLRGPTPGETRGLEQTFSSSPLLDSREGAARPVLKTLIGPILGRPHPGSPAELRLHDAIEATADLAGRFDYNRRVQTLEGTHPVVDLVSRQGPLCVEVDSFRYHGGRGPFGRDRQRDYELMASGKVVLRLTHDEIMDDVTAAVEKVRRVLHAFEEETR